MLIYLAGLQGLPRDVLAAAQVDGASAWRRFWVVTLPLLTPTILFNLVLDLIGGLQTFTQAYVVTQGGPGNASLFYLLYLYRNAFSYFRMGYASALAWLLFGFTLVVTALIFRSGRRWVFYEGAAR
jgi:multiple sugar transport system permease protein